VNRDFRMSPPAGRGLTHIISGPQDGGNAVKKGVTNRISLMGELVPGALASSLRLEHRYIRRRSAENQLLLTSRSTLGI